MRTTYMTQAELDYRHERQQLCAQDPCGCTSCPVCNGQDEEERKVLYHPGTVRFVTVYLVQRCYGGPQEGGWWYDAGEVEAVYACPTEAEAEALAESLRQDQYSNKGRRGLSSVLSSGECRVTVGIKPGDDYPAMTPRYE